VGSFRWIASRIRYETSSVQGQLNVRRATAEDFDAWFRLFEQVAAEGRWIGSEAPLDRPARRQSFERTLDADTAATFVAEAAGLLLGHLGVTLEHGLAEIGMMVSDEYRGQGIGSALMEACIEWCRAKRAHKITLAVWPHNMPGLALYEKFGFVVEGRLVRHYRRRNGELWDVIVMGLELDSDSPGSSF
jgi:ribosomal protein S18 acetylase RimI-like enzyme